jgi:hypothetical protein
LSSAPCYGIGTQKREDSLEKKKAVPGPGTYENKTIIGKDGLSKTFGTKSDMNSSFAGPSRNVPGPGAYNTTLTNLKTNPKFGIGTSKRDNERHNSSVLSASPGSYDPKIEFSKTQMPKIGFGSSKRAPLNHDNKAPGPGEYSLKTKAFENSRFHMGIKLQTKDKDKVPGPGDYEA